MIPTLSGDARTVGDFGEDLVDMSCHLFSRWRTGVAEKGWRDGAWEELEEGGFRRSSIGGQGEVIGTSRGPHAQRTCSIRWMGTILRYRITPHCESPHGQYTIFTLVRLTITIILHYFKRCSFLNSKPCKQTTSKRESWLSRLHI